MAEYSVPRFHLAWTDAVGGSCTGEEKTSTGIQQELRTMRLAVDQLWAPFQYLAIWHEGRRVASYEYQTNDETIDWTDCWMLKCSRSLRNEWERLIRTVRLEMARRKAADLLHRIHEDDENGGYLMADDLIQEGLRPGPVKTRPGYCPRAERQLSEELELYSGAYGAGFIQHIPRYDTLNYHYVKYWLYDLDEVTPDG